MTPLTEQRVAQLLQPYAEVATMPADLCSKVVTYVELLLRWNARTNLTAVREPELLVRRQVGESVFAAQLLQTAESLLDVGSGAGFPGIPIKLMLPGLRITLAESQGKKASFLREAARVLELELTVWPQRIEVLPPEQTFEEVIMRAVDNSAAVLEAAKSRVAAGGGLVRYVSSQESAKQGGWDIAADLSVPRSAGHLIRAIRS